MTGFSSTRSSARQFDVAGAPSTNRCAQALSAMSLRGAGADEIGKPRIRNLDRRMQRADGVEHLLHAVGRRSRRQIGAPCERRIRARRRASRCRPWRRCRHRQSRSRLRMRPAIGPSTLMCFCPASLVAAIFQPNRRPVECVASAAWIGVAFGAVARPLRWLRARRAWCRRANDRAGCVTPPRSGCHRAWLISLERRQPITILVSGPSRSSSRSIADRVIETQPAVGAKFSRARCRNTALPRPAMRGAAVVVDLDDEIVEMIVARQPVAAAIALPAASADCNGGWRGLRTRRLRAGWREPAERCAAADGGRRATTIAAAGTCPSGCRHRLRVCWP